MDKKCHVGRTYADFLSFIAENPDFSICEMDTVEGKKGGRVILTMSFQQIGEQNLLIPERSK